MATCKECIHEKLCVIKAFPDAFENTQWEKEPCDHFKSTADVVPKSEWISVKERLPDTTPKELVILDQDISSGKIENETDAGIAQVSETVAVLCKRCINGKVGLYYELDYTINGRWAYTEGVTHWMPLPEAPPAERK